MSKTVHTASSKNCQIVAQISAQKIVQIQKCLLNCFPEAAERLAGVLHEEVGGEEAAEDADVGLKDLHRVGLVEVDVVDDCMGLLFGSVASFRAET